MSRSWATSNGSTPRCRSCAAPGEIVQANETWQEAAGGGADAAVQLRRLAAARCLITALGDDALDTGRSTSRVNAGSVEAVWREEPKRRAVSFSTKGRADDRATGAEARAARLRSAPPARARAPRRRLLHRRRRGSVRAARQAKVLVASARELRCSARPVELRPRHERRRSRGARPRWARAAPATSSAPKEPAAAQSSRAPASRPARYLVPRSTCTAPAHAFAAGLDDRRWASGVPIETALELASRRGACRARGLWPLTKAKSASDRDAGVASRPRVD